MNDYEHDYALLGLEEDGDVMLSGPWEEALQMLSLIAQHLNEMELPEGVSRATTVMANESVGRASIVVLTQIPDGSIVTEVHLMVLPIPRTDDDSEKAILTDLGRWELEMREHLEAVGEEDA